MKDEEDDDFEKDDKNNRDNMIENDSNIIDVQSADDYEENAKVYIIKSRIMELIIQNQER